MENVRKKFQTSADNQFCKAISCRAGQLALLSPFDRSYSLQVYSSILNGSHLLYTRHNEVMLFDGLPGSIIFCKLSSTELSAVSAASFTECLENHPMTSLFSIYLLAGPCTVGRLDIPQIL